jgi:hypothetical protein
MADTHGTVGVYNDNNHIFETTQAIKSKADEGVKYTKEEPCYGNIFRAVLLRVITSSVSHARKQDMAMPHPYSISAQIITAGAMK